MQMGERKLVISHHVTQSLQPPMAGVEPRGLSLCISG